MSLHERHHAVAVSHGMLGALGMRVLLSLAGAALLQRFAWVREPPHVCPRLVSPVRKQAGKRPSCPPLVAQVILGFATLLLLTGIKMLCFDSPPTDASKEGGGGGGGGGEGGEMAGRCLGKCFPLIWDDSTGDRYFVRDGDGRLCGTRMAVVVLAICRATQCALPHRAPSSRRHC